MHPHRVQFPRRRGYILVMTLALLVLSSTLLVAVGRAATHHALQARVAQIDLQERWGVRSCRIAVLSHAEQILQTSEQQRGMAVPDVRADVPLGEDRFTLIVGDEQAKANVNLMIDQSGIESAETHIRTGLQGSGLLNHIHLRPSLIADNTPKSTTQATTLIYGPGQIFNSVGPEELIRPRQGSIAALQSLTCWGDGPINIMRANRQSLRFLFTPALTQLEMSRLVTARDKVLQLSIESHGVTGQGQANKNNAIDSLLSAAMIDPGKRNGLAVTTRSKCHSLWIIMSNGRRQTYTLVVSDESKAAQPAVYAVTW